MEINKAFCFVDLPGYGYANVPLSVRKKWLPLIEGYLKNRSTLRLVIIIGDIRREPHEEEMLYAAWLNQHGIPLMIVLTKIDKVTKQQQIKSLKLWKNRLGIEREIILFSAATGEGKDRIWKHLTMFIKSHKELD
jgi:GTP-binding protein